MTDFEIRGAEDFQRLSKALKDAGRNELRKELTKGLRDATKPLIKRTRAEALSRLPRRGGLGKRVAKTSQRVAVKTGRNPGVSIIAGKKRGAAGTTNDGFVKHPVFGNRNVWVEQKVRGGWFEDPLKNGASEVRPELEKALERVADKVVREAG